MPLPDRTQTIRLRWRRTNFAHQNRGRKLSGTRNGSNATVYSLMHKWFSFKIKGKGKGKGKVQRRTVHEGPEWSRGITTFFKPSARWGGWSTSRPGRFTSGNNPVPIVREAGWALGPVRTGAENLAPTDSRSPDCPSRKSKITGQLFW